MEAAALKRGTVLFVDDERRVLTSMRAMFRRDYEVLLANSGQEAIDLLRDHAVDVIVSDQRMPGMTGVEVLKAVKTLAPNAMRILLTGYADLKAIEASINEGEVFRYLTKPCPSEQLKEAIGLAAEIAAHAEPSQHAAEPDVGVEEEIQIALPAPLTVSPRADAVRPQPTSSAPPHPIPVRKPQMAPRFSTPPGARSNPPLTPILRRPPQKAAGTGPEMRSKKGSASDIHDVDLLVFTRDAEMVKALGAALDGSHRLHHVQSLEAAVAALEAHPIGVMVTDTGVSEEQIGTLTTTLKRHVPELVTIVASSRSDAQVLIDLINFGQIFRFLLKPLHGGQCRLSIESAVIKHRELAADPTMRRRHAVPEREVAPDSLIATVFGRIRRLRDRFLTLNGMA
jgi:DNA-binding NtrC family response regulator